jgi:hypothetical protein
VGVREDEQKRSINARVRAVGLVSVSRGDEQFVIGINKVRWDCGWGVNTAAGNK